MSENAHLEILHTLSSGINVVRLSDGDTSEGDASEGTQSMNVSPEVMVYVQEALRIDHDSYSDSHNEQLKVLLNEERKHTHKIIFFVVVIMLVVVLPLYIAR